MGRKPCCSKEEVNRGAWSFREDEILRNYINTHGEGKWRALPLKAGLDRCGKSCRLRWLNYLSPEIKRGNISKDEEDLIIRLHSLLGNRWSLIAGRLPGRTDNEIKNYWNTNLGKRVSCQNSPSISARKRSKALEEKKVIHDKVPNNNIRLIRTKAIRHSNLKSHMNQYQGAHHRSNEAINCNDTNMPNSSVVHSGDPAIVYEDLKRLMGDDHDHGQSSNNNTNTNTISTPEIEASNDQIGLQNTNLDEHFRRADNDKPFIRNDGEEDPSKSIRSLPYSDLLVDANGIEIKIVDKVDEVREINGAPNMEINLMLEIKKLASFLELEDEWYII